MAAAGPVLSGAGAGLGAYGTLAEGYAAAGAADYNADVAKHNARLTRAQSAEEERRSRVISRKAIGDMRANYGASGITTEGSPLDILQESAATAEMDALTIRHQGEVKAIAYENESVIERYKAKQMRTGAKIGAASGLLSGAGSVAGMI